MTTPPPGSLVRELPPEPGEFLWVGDAVRMTHRKDIRQGVITKVTSGRTPYWVDFTDGTRLKCSGNILTKLKDAEAAEVLDHFKKRQSEATVLQTGEFCMFTGDMLAKYPGVYVVTGVKAGNEYRLILAGGDPEGRYFPSIAGHKLRKVTVQLEVAE